jgi:pimeloyl-ACP methyl ester carboxylesterase
VLDLDFAPGGYSTAQRTWFLERGYAIGGIQRTQNETAYELKQYVDDLIAVRDALIAAGASEPSRTVAFGSSRGAFVSRKAVEYRPDVFVGAVAAAAGRDRRMALGRRGIGAQDASEPGLAVERSTMPDIPGRTTVQLCPDVALGQLVTLARSTTQGMARLVLAGAFEQATGWGSGPTRPADDDYELQGNLVAASFAFGNPQFVHKEIEVMAGGPVVWNHGVDYRDLLDRSGDRARVEYWYAKAGLDLEADLDFLNAAPRYSADPRRCSA